MLISKTNTKFDAMFYDKHFLCLVIVKSTYFKLLTHNFFCFSFHSCSAPDLTKRIQHKLSLVEDRLKVYLRKKRNQNIIIINILALLFIRE